MNEEILDSDPSHKKVAPYFKWRGILIWLGVILLSYVFKVLHWGGASILVMLGTAGLGAYSVCGLVRQTWTDTVSLIFSLFSTIWFLILVYGAFLNEGHPYNTAGLGLYMIIFIIYFVCYFLISGWGISKNNRK